MRYLPIARVTPGLILGRTVFDAQGTALLTAGSTLTSTYLTRLKELGYPALYVRSPEDRDDFEIVEPVREGTRLRAQGALYRLALDLTVKGASPEGFELVVAAVSELLNDILANQDLLISIMEIRSLDSYTFGHSVNTCLLSLMAGLSLEFDRRQLLELGTGTLLHDLGKLFVPPQILNKPASLTPKEFDQIRGHCQRGYVLLRDQLAPLAAHVAYQHHERCNGSGYPRGLKNRDMTAFARVVAVADSFDAMTSDRVYSQAMLPEQAAAILRREAPDKYDPECVKAVTRLVAPYPIGAAVRLDSGEVGEVVNVSRTQTWVLVTRGMRRGQTIVCPDEQVIAGPADQ
jgi:HD-GYP domain-containing protein (c-di-GMP phosphodiesterase class II)